jgi:hypothetical protein
MTSGTDKKAHVKELKASGKSVTEIMEIVGLKRPTIYAYLRPDQPKVKAKAKVNGEAGPTGLTVTPTKSGRFLVEVPADRLAKVAAALAA